MLSGDGYWIDLRGWDPKWRRQLYLLVEGLNFILWKKRDIGQVHEDGFLRKTEGGKGCMSDSKMPI